MSPRRFPGLVVMQTRSIIDTSGMIRIANFDLASLCDDDLVPGTKASVLLKEAVADLQSEAMAIASGALDFNNQVRRGPYLSVLPKLDDIDHALILSWQGVHGLAYIASTLEMPHWSDCPAEYAGFNNLGQIVYFGDEIPTANSAGA